MEVDNVKIYSLIPHFGEEKPTTIPNKPVASMLSNSK
jgi:hypothetical protein